MTLIPERGCRDLEQVFGPMLIKDIKPDAREADQKFDGFLAQEQEEVTPGQLCSGATKCSPSAPTKKNR